MRLTQIESPWIRRPLILAIPFLAVWALTKHVAEAFCEGCGLIAVELKEGLPLMWAGEQKKRYV